MHGSFVRRHTVARFILLLFLRSCWSNPGTAAELAPPPQTLNPDNHLTSFPQWIAEQQHGLTADSTGPPARCVQAPDPPAAFAIAPNPEGSGGGPSPTRAWEAIPGVIRNDGVDTFRLEVTLHASVRTVTLEVYAPFRAVSDNPVINLLDDGRGLDRSSGDLVFTSELLRYNTQFPMGAFFRYDTNSPRGLSLATAGTVRTWENDGTTNQFLILPSVGVLDQSRALTTSIALSSNVVVTPHLVNVQSSGRWTQNQMRFVASGLQNVTSRIYAVLPDEFDFLVFFSTDHVEVLPRTSVNNFNAGVHQNVRINFTGTGQTTFNQSALYGSQGRLQGLNALDTLERGLYSQNLVHELTHQWAAFLDPSLGLSEDGSHYKSRSSAASLVGGVQFVSLGFNRFLLDCDQGRARGRRAPALDRYLMGLIVGSSVPPLRVYAASLPLPFSYCGQVVSDIERVVTIEQIQTVHGVRSPEPAFAQKKFNLGFIAESHNRWLTPVELTFYDILAAHCTKTPNGLAEPPSQAFNWVDLSGYFGEGTQWHSQIQSMVTPRLLGMDRAPDGTRRVRAIGFPRLNYSLEASEDLRSWVEIDSGLAGADGRFELADFMEATTNSSHRFFRLACH